MPLPDQREQRSLPAAMSRMLFLAWSAALTLKQESLFEAAPFQPHPSSPITPTAPAYPVLPSLCKRPEA